jgi:hypothetical protein
LKKLLSNAEFNAVFVELRVAFTGATVGFLNAYTPKIISLAFFFIE